MDKTHPLISVLIAQYNNSRFLPEAIDSIKKQTYKNYEIVIVDDASEDDSGSFYRTLKDQPDIRIFINDRNYGEGYTKRRCVEYARGSVCGFLDPDDVLLDDALEKMVKLHIIHPDLAMIFSRMYLCDSEMNIESESRKLEIPEGKTYFTNRDYAPEHFVTFKKDYYMMTEGIASHMRAAADQDMYFKLEEVGKLLVIDDFTLKYRRHTGGLTFGKSMNSTWFWHLMARYETCIRRDLDIRQYVLRDFLENLEKTRDQIIKGMQL